MLSLTNAALRFHFDPASGYWYLAPAGGAWPRLEEARLGAIYRVGAAGEPGRWVYWDGELLEAEAEPLAGVPTAHGPAVGLRVRARTATDHAADPLALTLTFLLPERRPFLLWQAVAHNAGPEPLNLEVIDLLRVGPRFQPRTGRSGLLYRLRTLFQRETLEEPHPRGPAGVLRLGAEGTADADALAFFSNGYQSWSFAGALHARDHQPGSIFGPLGQPKALNLLTPSFRRAGRFSSDMFGVLADRAQGRGVVAGFTSQREQFSAVEVLLDPAAPSLRLTAQCDQVCLEPGAARTTDWAYMQLCDLAGSDTLNEYADAVARENEARVPAQTPVGWCSWYHYFDRVTEADVLANLRSIAAARETLPLDFVQIDDGFQTQVGDWFETKPTFGHGLRWLAAEIRAQGHAPGLWLAPYMVRSDARLLRDHPDWFLRQSDGRRANAGFNWFRWCYGLDPTHPAVREHVRRLISTAVQAWGFPYLKLDFLYAAALPAQRYDPTLTRAQAMRLALTDLREAAGEGTFLLGCGCPLGSAVGLVDGMRVSTDVAPDWDPQLFTPRLAPLLYREMDFVGVRNALRNTLNRAPLHGRWWLNDPDCLIVRDTETRLTEAEVRSLATVIGLSGGMFLVSDDMQRLPPERRRYVTALLPVLGQSAAAPGWLDDQMPEVFVLRRAGVGDLPGWTVAGLFNWTGDARQSALDLRALMLDPAQDYWVSEFWEGDYQRLPAGEALRLSRLPPHGAHLVAVRPVRAGEPELVASSFHFSQGGEVTQWAAGPGRLTATLRLGRVAEGEWRLALPAPPATVTVDEQPLVPEELGPGVYRLRFQVNHAAQIVVEWP
ncbi:MAG: alpha-galactosidase [Anaerolineales bacterium]|nr:alpha-galactosidase [Anaerolineales bacterium]